MWGLLSNQSKKLYKLHFLKKLQMRETEWRPFEENQTDHPPPQCHYENVWTEELQNKVWMERKKERERERDRGGILSQSGMVGNGFHAARRPLPADSGSAHARW